MHIHKCQYSQKTNKCSEKKHKRYQNLSEEKKNRK